MVLHVGDKAPEFFLPATKKHQVRLSDFVGKNIVLVFFPLAWTPI